MVMNIKLSDAQKNAAVNDSSSIAAIMQQILKRENRLGRSQEHFWVIGLNAANKILFIELIGLGRQNRVNANPPDVFRLAIHKLALKLIMVHNHPSGELKPSAADREITDRILKVGEIINVAVLDHLIISETGYFSFADEGIMAELRSSNSWRLMERQDLETQKFLKEVELQETALQAKREVAKNLKASGMDEATIKKMTGLTLKEIRGL